MNEKIQETLDLINKNFGKGTVVSLSENNHSDIDIVSTGSIGLDSALGVGGLPKGKIVEILGMESSGKTTIATHVIAEAQKKGIACAFIDAEHVFDKEYAKKLGVNVDELVFNQPDYGEQGLEVAEKLISSGQFGVVIIDSVAALVPKKELEGEMGDQSMGLQARMMSQALRKLVGTTSKNNCILIFINQFREKIGVMFGDNRTPSGGNALRFYSAVRLEVSRSTTEANSVKEGEEKIGNLTKIKVLKNKVASPFRTCEFDIIYGKGIWKEKELLIRAVEKKIIEKSGSWFSYKGSKIGQGLTQACQTLEDNPELFSEIKVQI